MIKGIFIIWYRDILRFWRNKIRVVSGLSFPILWLLIFGNGISSSLALPIPGIKFVQFLFPGIIAQNLIFVASFAAVSILQDREFGFLKEILVAPIPRTAIAVGKVLGGATTACIQALTILIFAPLVGIHLSVRLVVELIPAMFLMALALSALGVTIVARLRSIDSGQYIFQFITFPLIFLSGAVFPLINLPRWLDIASKVNPVSYAVDILRRVVFSTSNLPPQASQLYLRVGSHSGLGLDLLVTIGFALVLIGLSTLAFRQTD